MTTERREETFDAPRTRRRERRLPETKTFALASEFWVFVLGVAAMLFAAYVVDDIADATAWRFVAFIGMAYIVSRGIAKSGSRRGFEPGWSGSAGPRYEGTAEDEWAQRRSGAVT